jgi:hypothetical protein
MKLMDIRPVTELEEDAGWDPLEVLRPVPRYRLENGAGKSSMTGSQGVRKPPGMISSLTGEGEDGGGAKPRGGGGAHD